MNKDNLESLEEWEFLVKYCETTRFGLMEQLIAASDMKDIFRLQGQIDILRSIPFLPSQLFPEKGEDNVKA